MSSVGDGKLTYVAKISL